MNVPPRNLLEAPLGKPVYAHLLVALEILGGTVFLAGNSITVASWHWECLGRDIKRNAFMRKIC